MARTWSNRKRPAETLSAAQRARLGRPSGVTTLIIALTVAVVFFMGLTFWATYQSFRHPLTEVYQAPTDHPKDD